MLVQMNKLSHLGVVCGWSSNWINVTLSRNVYCCNRVRTAAYIRVYTILIILNVLYLERLTCYQDGWVLDNPNPTTTSQARQRLVVITTHRIMILMQRRDWRGTRGGSVNWKRPMPSSGLYSWAG